ncbi:MAG: hypothetical protein LBG80_15785, partial [Bacteroidales bacterium]|nr:hypothetical protein [Bacteroidales bacterium]
AHSHLQTFMEKVFALSPKIQQTKLSPLLYIQNCRPLLYTGGYKTTCYHIRFLPEFRETILKKLTIYKEIRKKHLSI